MTDPAAVEQTIAGVLRGEGLTDRPGEYDSDIHSWRCRYPEQYGPCSCFQDLVSALAVVVADAEAEAGCCEWHAAGHGVPGSDCFTPAAPLAVSPQTEDTP